MITDKLKELVATYVEGIINTGDVGLGGNSTSPVATTLDVPLGLSVTPSVVKSSDNVVEVKISIAGSTSALNGKVVREAGVFNSSNMLIRNSFTGVGPFSASETLEIFFIFEVE